MSYIVTTENVLSQAVAPNLPLATPQYDPRYLDQLNNVLRLYFNQLDKIIGQLQTGSGSIDGTGIRFPYGAFHQDGTTTLTTSITNNSTTPVVVGSTAQFPAAGWFLIESEIISYTGKTSTSFTGITRGVLGTTNVAHTAGVAISAVQGTGAPTTIGVVLFNNTDFSNQITASANYDRVNFSVAGLYNLQLSVQLLNFTTSEDNATIWLRKNGADVSASAGVVQVNSKHGSSPGAVIASWNYFIDMAAGDYVQLVWTSDTGNTVVSTLPAGTSPVHPASPALIFTAQFVSALP